MHSNGTLKRQKCSIVLVKNTKVFVMAHTYPFNKRHSFSRKQVCLDLSIYLTACGTNFLRWQRKVLYSIITTDVTETQKNKLWGLFNIDDLEEIYYTSCCRCNLKNYKEGNKYLLHLQQLWALQNSLRTLVYVGTRNLENTNAYKYFMFVDMIY